LKIYIFFQGSVATQLRCGGIFCNHFITNFSQNVPMKKFWKSVNIWQYMDKSLRLLGPPCTCKTMLKILR